MSQIPSRSAHVPNSPPAHDRQADQDRLEEFGAHEDNSPQIVVRTTRARYVLGAAELCDEDLTRRLREDACAEECAPLVALTHLIDLPDLSRRNALQLFRRLSDERSAAESRTRRRVIILDDGESGDDYRFVPCRYDVAQGQVYTDLFSAVLALMAGDADLERCDRGLQTALMAAQVLHPNALELACNRIEERLAELNIRGIHTRSLIRQAQDTTLAALDPHGEPELEHVRDTLPTAPVPLHAVIPRRWAFSRGGITRSYGGPILIATPMVLSERLVDVADGTESLRIAWLRDRQWNERIVERTLLASSSRITELAAYGIGVNSINARIAVQFCADFESENIEIIPQTLVTRRTGWQGRECQDGFLLGRELLTESSSEPYRAGASGAGGEQQRQRIRFRGIDAGDEQLVAGLHVSGSFDTWREIISLLADYPKAKFILCSAFVPPLLLPLGISNFVCSAAGPTSHGKTTALRAAASVWGAPDERASAAAIATWDATRTFFERASAVLGDMSLICDDTQRAKNDRMIAQTIYDVCSGRGRGRGSLEGLRAVDTFRTVLISSGERRLSDYSPDETARARVLECWGAIFNRTDAETGAVVTRISEAVRENYGHAGRAWIQFLIANRGNSGNWEA